MALEQLIRKSGSTLYRTLRRGARTAKHAYGSGKTTLRAVQHVGWSRRCTVCGRSSRNFLPHGNPPRPQARCPHCGALERHRFAWSYLNHHTNLFDGKEKAVLHFAPERCFEPRLRRSLGSSYVTADLTRNNVDQHIDVTNIPFPDESVDVILCSHVLEHVPDDRSAMRELARVLHPGGWALVIVPIKGRETFEDPSIVDPDERMRVFGQFDHVRLYGDDIEERLEDAGFTVTRVRPVHSFNPEELKRFGLERGGNLFVCAKVA